MNRLWRSARTTGYFIAVASVLSAAVSRAQSPPQNTYFYWDQQEQEDLFVDPIGAHGNIVPTSDTNGQLCVFPDSVLTGPRGTFEFPDGVVIHKGSFVVGYNPTLPSQNLEVTTFKTPPVGLSVFDSNGSYSGERIFVAGPFFSGDIPPDICRPGDLTCVCNAATGACSASSGAATCSTAACTFNNNGTYTGCAFDSDGNLYAADLGTAQGQVPVPDDGRLIRWTRSSGYAESTILYGPTTGGFAVNHVDGSGGLRDPGILAMDFANRLYLPEAGGAEPITMLLPGFGRVLKFETASQTTGQFGRQIKPTVFFQGNPAWQPFPSAIALDPGLSTPTGPVFAVSSVIGSPAVAWYDSSGTPVVGKGPVPPGNYSPFGLAFNPAGDLYLVDIHIICGAPSPEQIMSGSPVNCGPQEHAGQILRISFTNGVPSLPTTIAGYLNFPVSVTACTPSTTQSCPKPAPPSPITH